MSDPNLQNAIPKVLSEFTILLTKYNGQVIDISQNVTAVSIYESIFTPFLYGSMTVIDNSAMASVFPFIGQEKVRISWVRAEARAQKDFYVYDVKDMKTQTEGTGSYTLTFTSEKQFRNNISLFSKSYSGNAADIIKNVYDEWLIEPGSNKKLKLNTTAAASHNVVFPYIKPLAAINMIQENALADDGTPMFVFETLYSEDTVLDSMKRMLEQEKVFTIEPVPMSATDPEPTREMNKYDGQIYSTLMEQGYETLARTGNGVFASQITSVDIAARKADITDFSFREHAKPIANDWVSAYFAFDDNRIHTQYNTQNRIMYKNTLAFGDDEFPNLTGLDELEVAIMNSYLSRLSTVSVLAHINSAPEIESGKVVEYKKERFSPKLAPADDPDDKVSSGNYLVASIHHHIRRQEYTMSIELVRDGMGKEADLYNNQEVNLGVPPRRQVSILDYSGG